MDVIFIDIVLCELANDYGTSPVYTEGHKEKKSCMSLSVPLAW